MRLVITLILSFFVTVATAQNLVPFGGSRKSDTAFADRALKVNGVIKASPHGILLPPAPGTGGIPITITNQGGKLSPAPQVEIPGVLVIDSAVVINGDSELPLAKGTMVLGSSPWVDSLARLGLWGIFTAGAVVVDGGFLVKSSMPTFEMDGGFMTLNKGSLIVRGDGDELTILRPEMVQVLGDYGGVNLGAHSSEFSDYSDEPKPVMKVLKHIVAGPGGDRSFHPEAMRSELFVNRAYPGVTGLRVNVNNSHLESPPTDEARGVYAEVVSSTRGANNRMVGYKGQVYARDTAMGQDIEVFDNAAISNTPAAARFRSAVWYPDSTLTIGSEVIGYSDSAVIGFVSRVATGVPLAPTTHVAFTAEGGGISTNTIGAQFLKSKGVGVGIWSDTDSSHIENLTAPKLNIPGLPEHADNAAAISAGLVPGDLYRTGDLLKVAH